MTGDKQEFEKLTAEKLKRRYSGIRYGDGAVSPSSSFAIEDEDVWQALVHKVPGHGQGLEVGRNGDLASFHNLAFEFIAIECSPKRRADVALPAAGLAPAGG